MTTSSRDCTHKGWVLGSEKFKTEIEALTQRRASSKGVGRPRVVDLGLAIDRSVRSRLARLNGSTGETKEVEAGSGIEPL